MNLENIHPDHARLLVDAVKQMEDAIKFAENFNDTLFSAWYRLNRAVDILYGFDHIDWSTIQDMI